MSENANQPGPTTMPLANAEVASGAQPNAPATSALRAVVLAGGGTAGHVNPLLAVADEVRRRNPDARILVLGTKVGLEADLVPARGYQLWPVPKVPLPRRPSPDFFRLPGKLTSAVRAAEGAITEIGAQVVIGFGGYVSTPAYFAAHRRGIPIVVHEQNAKPGLANRIGARWASRVGVTFPGTALPRGQVVGMPLRAEIVELIARRAQDPAGERRRAANLLGLDPTMPTLLVTGGSSGALSVNRAVAAAAPSLLAAGVQVLHLTGKGKDQPVRAVLAELPETGAYQVREYLSEMDLALACADLVVCRSGAGMVCELAALGLPAVYVPLPIGNGEQRLNAAGVVAGGGGIIVDDSVFTAHWVAQHIPAILADRRALKLAARAAASFGVRDAAARIVDLMEVAAAAPPPDQADHVDVAATDGAEALSEAQSEASGASSAPPKANPPASALPESTAPESNLPAAGARP